MEDDEGDSDSEMGIGDFSSLPHFSELTAKRKIPNYPAVSGWEDDDEGIEDERNPDDKVAKDVLKYAEFGELENLMKLISVDKNLISVADKDGYTPLHRASYNNNKHIIEALLKMGADLAAVTIDNWQPLHCACKWNSFESALILIRNGANVNAKTNAGATPLHLAAGNRDAHELIQLILSHPLLVSNEVDKSNDTPLAIASRSSLNDYLFECLEPCFL